MQSSLLGSTSLLGMAFALRLWDSNILQDTVQHWLSLRDSTDPSYKQSPRMHQQGRKSLQSTRCNLETQLHWHSSQHCMRHMQQHPTVQVDCSLYHEDTLLEKWRWLDSKLQQDTVWLQSSLLGSTSLLGMALALTWWHSSSLHTRSQRQSIVSLV